MYPQEASGALFGSFAPPTVVGQQQQVAVQQYAQPPRVERHVTVHRQLIPQTHTVQVPRVIPTQHTVVENHPFVVHEAHTVHDNVAHTVVDNHTVLENHTITVLRTIVENHTVTEQIPRTVLENRTILVPRTVVDAHTIKEPHTVLEAVPRVIQVPRVVPEERQVQVPRTEYHQRQVVQQVPRTVLEPRTVVQQVPRTVFGQKTIVHQHQVQTARVVETPRITEIERPQIIQHVIPGRARQYMAPPRVVGQVQGGVQHVGSVETGHTIIGQQQQWGQAQATFVPGTQFAHPHQFAQTQTRLVAQPVVGQFNSGFQGYPSYGSFGAPQFASAGHAGFPQYVSQAHSQQQQQQQQEEDAFRA